MNCGSVIHRQQGCLPRKYFHKKLTSTAPPAPFHRLRPCLCSNPSPPPPPQEPNPQQPPSPPLGGVTGSAPQTPTPQNPTPYTPVPQTPTPQPTPTAQPAPAGGAVGGSGLESQIAAAQRARQQQLQRKKREKPEFDWNIFATGLAVWGLLVGYSIWGAPEQLPQTEMEAKEMIVPTRLILEPLRITQKYAQEKLLDPFAAEKNIMGISDNNPVIIPFTWPLPQDMIDDFVKNEKAQEEAKRKEELERFKTDSYVLTFRSEFYLARLQLLVYAAILIPAAKSRNKIPIWPFIAGSFAYGGLALFPYFFLTSGIADENVPPKKREMRGWLNAPLRMFESNIFAIVLIIACMICYYDIGNFIINDPSLRLAFYRLQYSSSQVNTTSLSIVAMAIYLPFWMANDAERRNFKFKDFASYFAILPVLGPAIYLLLRPKSKKGE